MKSSTDPSVHRQREQQFMAHVQQLLEDDRLRIDTLRGRRPVASLLRDVRAEDRSVDLKRAMSEMNVPDRALESRMPVGELIEVVVSQKKWFLFRSGVGRMYVACASPTRALLRGEAPAPLHTAEVRKL